jgi:hypothetical protein
VTVVARSGRSSGKKHGSQSSTAARLDIDGAHARRRDTEQARVSRRTIVIAAMVAAATIVSGGLALRTSGPPRWSTLTLRAPISLALAFTAYPRGV